MTDAIGDPLPCPVADPEHRLGWRRESNGSLDKYVAVFNGGVLSESILDKLCEAQKLGADLQVSPLGCIDINLEVHLVILQGETDDPALLREIRPFAHRECVRALKGRKD